MKNVARLKYALLIAVGAVTLAAHIDRPAAQTSNQPVAIDQATKGPLNLSEQDKETVIKAAVEAKTHQKTPKEFTPAIGTTVPKELYLSAFKPDVAREVPPLKLYQYAYLDREIVLIDSMAQKVVAVIPLPEKLVAGDQQHQGAAEPASRPPGAGGTDSTGSVPAYTSPESIK
jgi:hypothetical protein